MMRIVAIQMLVIIFYAEFKRESFNRASMLDDHPAHIAENQSMIMHTNQLFGALHGH
ncbi:hypothetical protein [Herminiimonas fonticola]|uniref:Uncharacterized protein n=1 Tax=Herminiimonas fonticola TaxID=303380 RepID=A0A4R6G3R8_9BURK|nr:hypothetical protein [Herminiimonas fonticola]RBA23274.1 hypothetical protein Hfont_2617 [Herminiimonas fonticola]TDN88993.1 hypothetical protein EV677_2580 [Herminiimonas fonticola]